jgi:hypothetical protein
MLDGLAKLAKRLKKPHMPSCAQSPRSNKTEARIVRMRVLLSQVSEPRSNVYVLTSLVERFFLPLLSVAIG